MFIRHFKIYGGNNLLGSETRSFDVRAGAAFVIARLVADGMTIVTDYEQVKGGDENFIEKLKKTRC